MRAKVIRYRWQWRCGRSLSVLQQLVMIICSNFHGFASEIGETNIEDGFTIGYPKPVSASQMKQTVSLLKLDRN